MDGRAKGPSEPPAKADPNAKKRFKTKRPRPQASTHADSLKEKVNPHIPVLKPGNVAELLTFKARLADHLRAEFTYNGNILATNVYYTGEDTLSFVRTAHRRMVELGKPKPAPPAQRPKTRSKQDTSIEPVEDLPQDATTEDDEDLQEDEEDEELTDQGADAVLEELDELIRTMPEKAQSKLLEAQASQAARMLLDNRLAAQQENVRIFALMLSKLSEASLASLRNHPSADQVIRAANDPLKLWKLVEITHMGTSANKESQLYQLVRAYQMCRQDFGESIHAYYEKFVELTSTMETYGCPMDPEPLRARHFLQQLDRSRYGRFLMDMQNMVSSGAIAGYPRTVNAAYKLAKERVEPPNSGNPRNRFNNPVAYATTADSLQSGGNNRGTKKGKKGGAAQKGAKQSPHVCDLCGQSGHFIRVCPKLDAAKEAVTKGTTRFAANTYGFEGDEAVYMTKGNTSCLGKWDILLDNQANVSVFNNPELLDNIGPGPPIKIGGFAGDAVQTSLTGTFLGVGPVYYAPTGTANILSFNQIERGPHKIKWKRNSHFVVHIQGCATPLFFALNRNGLYVADGELLRTPTHTTMMTTVGERESAYTKDQVHRARAAREMQARLGHASGDALARTLANGSILNCPVTVQDIARAKEIYGPDEAYLHGTQRKKPQKGLGILDNKTEQVREPQTLLVDIMFLEGDAYLVSVAAPLGIIMAAALSDKRAGTVAGAVLSQADRLRGKGFPVVQAISDPEATLIAAGEILNRHGIDFDHAGVEQHVARVEVAIKTVKERVRSILHGLPYKLPHQLMRYAVMYAVRVINVLVPSGKTVSPREILTGRKTDWKRDFTIPFGVYAHVPLYAGKRNGMQARTVAAISLGGIGNITGSADFFVLSTRRVVSRDHWTVIPMPDDAMEYINNLSQQGPTAINFKDEPVVENAKEDAPSTVEHTGGGILAMPSEGLEGLEEPGATPEVDALFNETSEPILEGTLPEEGIEPAPEPEPPPIAVPADAVTAAESEDVSRRRPTHLRQSVTRNTRVFNDAFIYNISVSEGLRKHGTTAEDSIKAELQQMLDKEVWRPVRFHEVPKNITIMPSFMFLKEKYDAHGQFVKVKSRLVAGGHVQANTWEQTSSPTVSLTSIMAVATIAATERRQVITADIGGAYLNAPMSNDQTYMILDKKTSEILSGMDPSYKPYIGRKGTIVVNLRKALYGCRESGLMWFRTLSEFLRGQGFEANPYDPCLVNKAKGKAHTTIALYVDDLFITGNDDDELDTLLKCLKERFKILTVTQGSQHSYLGMRFVFGLESVDVDMQTYEEDVLKAHSVSGSASSPASRDLFEVNESDGLSVEHKERFHTIVAKLAYLAKRTRPDILTAISFLSTRVQSPTNQDEQKLSRVLKYLNSTTGRKIVLKKLHDHPVAYVDAAYGVHVDCKSHTGIFITLGEGPIFVKSTKQKINSKSSTEAELIALSDAIGDIIWTKELLEAQQNYKKDFIANPAVVFEDNKSTITLLERPRKPTGATKHISIRYFFISDKIQNKEVQLKYKATDEMLADYLTKPITGEQFRNLRNKMMNFHLDPISRSIHVAIAGLCSSTVTSVSSRAAREHDDEHDDDDVTVDSIMTSPDTCAKGLYKRNDPPRSKMISIAHKNAKILEDFTML